MRSVCLCEKNETMTAMRLGGIESTQVTSVEEARVSLERLLEDPTVALVIVSENVHNMIVPLIMKTKLERKDTLIIQIPEPGGLMDKDYIMKYIKNSIGIKL